MKQNKRIAAYILASLSVLMINNTSSAQAVNYNAGQVIRLGAGESLQVIRCTGSTDDQQCELKYMLNNRQIGKPFWLKSAKIGPRKTPPKATLIAANKKPELPKKPVVAKRIAALATNTIAKKETPNLQADMLSMAKSLAQAQVPQQQPENKIKEAPQEAPPKKVKKEFVSHNPFLLKQFKSGDATVKQAPADPGKG